MRTKLNNLIQHNDICINLVGILYEKKKILLKIFILIFQILFLKMCNEHNIEQFIHVSALGIERAIR